MSRSDSSNVRGSCPLLEIVGMNYQYEGAVSMILWTVGSVDV